MMSELKPCPFCGELDDLTRSQDIISGEGDYHCISCGATGPIGEGPEIDDKWNTRTHDPRVMKLVEALKAQSEINFIRRSSEKEPYMSDHYESECFPHFNSATHSFSDLDKWCDELTAAALEAFNGDGK